MDQHEAAVLANKVGGAQGNLAIVAFAAAGVLAFFIFRYRPTSPNLTGLKYAAWPVIFIVFSIVRSIIDYLVLFSYGYASTYEMKNVYVSIVAFVLFFPFGYLAGQIVARIRRKRAEKS